MIPASENSNLAGLNLIHEAMFLIDPPGPASAQFVLQRLRFTKT